MAQVKRVLPSKETLFDAQRPTDEDKSCNTDYDVDRTCRKLVYRKSSDERVGYACTQTNNRTLNSRLRSRLGVRTCRGRTRFLLWLICAVHYTDYGSGRIGQLDYNVESHCRRSRWSARRIGEASHPGPHVKDRKMETKLLTYNVGASMGNCRMAVDWLMKDGSYAESGSDHHVQMVQEYSNTAASNNREYNLWVETGRRPVLTVSNTTVKGNQSAGLVTTAKSNAAVVLPKIPFQCNEITRGRVQATLKKRVAQSGIVLINAYFYDSEGLSDNNWMILAEIGLYLTSMGLPFIIAADFNLSPQALAESGWLGTVKGVIRAPTEWTCKVAEHTTGTTIDYFVISSSLRPLVDRVSVLPILHGQHRPVELILKGKMKQLYQWTIAAPMAFPVTDYAKLQSTSRERDDMPKYDWNMEDCSHDEMLGKIYEGIETELDHYLKYSEDYERDAKRLGRAKPIVCRRVKVQPKARKGEPRCSHQAEAWKKAARMLRSMYVQYSTGNTDEALYTAFRLSDHAQKLSVGKMILVEYCRSCIRWFGRDMVDKADEMAHECETKADVLERLHVNTRRWNYNKRLDDAALKGGARDAYAILKDRPERTVATDADNKGVDDQAHADAQVNKWAQIWSASYTGPCLSMHMQIKLDIQAEPGHYVLSGIAHTAKTVSAAAQKHKAHTAVGIERLSPKLVASLTKEGLEAVALFLNKTHEQWKWPDEMRQIIMACIPKEDGDWRLVGLLPMPFRIWAATVVDVVSAWMKSLNRSYLQFGSGKSSEDVAYKVALAAEAKGDELETLLAIGTLQKGFEMIRYHRLYRAAVTHRYPLDILILSIHMYTAARRAKCGDAVSRPVWASYLVVAGCPIAMSLMCLNLLKPFDDFVMQVPLELNELALYVDDFIMLLVLREGDDGQRERAVEAIRDLVARLDDNDSPVKKEKGRLLSTSKALSKQVCKQVKDLGFENVNESKILGVDTTTGGVVKYKAMRKRTNKATVKSKKANRIFAVRHKRVNMVRAFTSGSARYAAKVIGVPPRILSKIRPQMHKALGNNTGGSATTALALQPNRWIDPTYDAAVLAPIAWAKWVFSGDLTVNRMQKKGMEGS